MKAVDSLQSPELVAQAEQTKETLAALFSIDASKIAIDYEPTPMNVRSQEGCKAISDFGEPSVVDVEGWYEAEHASFIALIRIQRERGIYPNVKYSEVEELCIRPGCSPYRVLKTFIEQGITIR